MPRLVRESESCTADPVFKMFLIDVEIIQVSRQKSIDAMVEEPRDGNDV